MYSNEVSQTTPSQYELIVTHQGEAPQFHAVDKTLLLLGREANNDIPLVGQAVSRHHARLEQIGGLWHVVDLGSTNGTFLAGERLPANIAQLWQSGHPVQIGGFTLQWQSISSSLSDQTLVLMPNASPNIPNEIASDDTHDIVPDESLSVLLNATEIELRPEETVEVKLGILSTSQLSKQITFSIVGIPESWYSLSHETLRLAPKKHRSAMIKFHLPQGHSVQGGRHEFEVQIRSPHHPNQLTRVSGTLLIPSLSDFTIRTRQSGTQNSVQYQLQLENVGNTVEMYRVNPKHVGPSVRIRGDVWDVSLLPGASCWLSYHIQSENRPIFGSNFNKSFRLTVESSLKQEKTVTGSLTITPILPMFPVVTVLFILVALILGFALFSM